MTSPQSLIQQADEAKEFISKVQEAEKIYKEICEDVAKYRLTNVQVKGETKVFLNITECDVEHLNLEPFNHEVKKHKGPPKYTKMELPRAMSLRHNVCLSYIYDRFILKQLENSEHLTVILGQKDCLKALNVLKEWITSKKTAYQILKEFTTEMESMRPHFIGGKHLLSRRCVRVFELEKAWFEKKLETEIHKTSEPLLELMCNSCKQFALKSDELMNQLAPHFRTFLREYYSHHEVAEEIPLFIDAALQCKSILRNYLSFGVYIRSIKAQPDALNSTTLDFDGLNKTMLSMYDPNKYPDDKGFILFLTVSFETLVNCCGDEWCKDDRVAPRRGSVVHQALTYNLAEFDIFYKKLIDIIEQNVNVST